MADEGHTIRLTAAWERSEAAGWQRHFGRPAGIDGGQRVWLVLEGQAREPILQLNGTPLGAADRTEPDRWAWEVTSRLQSRNRLELAPHPQLAPPPETGRAPLPPAFGEVLLQIVDGCDVNNA